MPLAATLALSLLAYSPHPENVLDAAQVLKAEHRVNVFVAKSTIPLAGRGVFAARSFKENELIEEAEAIPFTTAEYPIGALRQYLFDSQQDDNQTVLVLNHGSLFNHAPTERAQVGYKPGKLSADGPQTFEFRALRYIPAGEELFIDYGYEPHPVEHAVGGFEDEAEVQETQLKKDPRWMAKYEMRRRQMAKAKLAKLAKEAPTKLAKEAPTKLAKKAPTKTDSWAAKRAAKRAKWAEPKRPAKWAEPKRAKVAATIPAAEPGSGDGEVHEKQASPPPLAPRWSMPSMPPSGWEPVVPKTRPDDPSCEENDATECTNNDVCNRCPTTCAACSCGPPGFPFPAFCPP